MTRVLHLASVIVLVCPQIAVANDYPTEARAGYVFGCMAVNGQTPEALRKCSCAIDVIATILPYDAYVAAETVLNALSRYRSGKRPGRGLATGGSRSRDHLLLAAASLWIVADPEAAIMPPASRCTP